MDIKHIREIAKKYTPEQIEGCITQQIETGKNMCLTDETSEKIINELSKADVVRELMDQGMNLADALRELARRMRLVQSGFKQ
jgi:methyl coenzyme M reductase subunit D